MKKKVRPILRDKGMSKETKQPKKKKGKKGEKEPRYKTPTFLLELPLRVDAGQARRLRAHFEVARLFYNARLSEAKKRLDHMRADPAWQAARSILRLQK